MSISLIDQKIIWHPFTQEQTASSVITIKRAKGAYIYDENNKSYLDLISSWWVNIHGHGHPSIAKSIYEQALELEHVIFAGFTHAPAVQLCQNLMEFLPSNLNRFFFSDNGSTSVEVALKMAYQYWYNQGDNKKQLFLSFDGGYHGDTFGSMSVGVKSGFHDNFSNFFFKVLTIPYPATWEGDIEIELKENLAIIALNKHLEKHQNQIAALIMEPLMQGAAGMRVCRVEFVKKVVELVRKQGILVIFDEVMTGFGRTGSYFALNQISIVPDFLCLSKGITGGFLPLALTVTTNEVFNKFLSTNWQQAFAHGHSYTANPLACRAAITSLSLLKTEATQNSIKLINETHKKGHLILKEIIGNVDNYIEHFRILGTISAFNLKKNDINFNLQLRDKFLQEGLLLRPLGNTIYLLPPYCINENELQLAYKKIGKTLTSIT